MSVTIDSLDIQIRSSAGSAAKNIEDLAQALSRLNANAKVTKVVNSLERLNTALVNMKSQSSVMSHLSALSKSLASLAAIPQLTGLRSAITELKKLPAVMDGLDTAKITEFTAKIKMLAKGLGPLATQIDKIGNGFAKLPPQVSKCVTAVKRLDSANKSASASAKAHGDAVNGASINFLAAYENLSNVFSMMHGVQAAFAAVMDDAIQWDGIQFRFGRAFGEDAEIVLEYAQKVSEELKINQQQFMQYSSLYGSLLKGFGMEQQQITTISVGLTELSYDIWAAYNDRYKTLEDASEAIRSAITGEIEPIRNAGIALTEASMQEFVDGYDLAAEKANDVVTSLEEIRNAANATGEMEPLRQAMSGVEAQADNAKSAVVDMFENGISNSAMQATADMLGLGMSVEKMTEAQKSELRYAVMVNAAMQQGIVGTYAREMQTAEGAVRTLTQQMKTLGQALGSLFLPILQKVVPWVSAFVELLTDGLIALGAMFGIKFQEIKWADPTGMKDTASSMKDTSAGAGSTADALGDAAKNAKKMMDYTMGFDELNIIDPPSADSGSGSGAGSGGAAGADTGGSLGLDLDTLWDDAVFASASKQIDELKQKIKDFYNEWQWQIEAFGAGTMLMTLGKIIEKLKEANIFSGGFLKNMNTVSKLGLSAVVITLQWTLMDQFLQNFIEEGSWEEFIKAAVTAALGTWALGAMWGPTGVIIGLGITAAVSLNATFADGSVDSMQEIVTGLSGIAAAVGAVVMILQKTDLGAALRLLFDGAKFSDVFAAWFPKTASITSTATTWVTGSMLPAMRTAITKLPTLLVNAVRAIPGWGWVVAAIAGLITLAVTDYDFTDIGYKVGHAIGTALKKIGEWLGKAGEWIADTGKAIWDGILSAIDWVKEEFDIKSVTDLIILLFNPVAWVKEIIPKMLEIGSEVLPGLWQGIKDGWNNFWGNIGEFIDGLVQGFKDALGIASPSKVFANIGKFLIEGLLGGITNKWNDLKKWFSTTVAPKFTLDYWKTKFDTIKQAVSTKLDEVKSAASAKWAAIKTWFSSNIAPKFTLSFWTDKFKNLKEGFTQTVKNMLNAGIDMLNKFIGWLNSKLSFSWDALTIAGKEVYPGGSIQLLTIPKITQRFEDGGFIEDGLFTMNRGEIAGKFSNGKSVVANNQQIVEGIAAGVYEAVVAAMNATSGRQDQNINVYLDGKQITAAVEKRQKERGVSLMGNQLGYVY